MSSKGILAIDIGSRSVGWALGWPRRVSASGTIRLPVDPIEAALEFRRRMLRLAGIETVLAERPVVSGKADIETQATTMWEWRELGIACRAAGLVGPVDVKSWNGAAGSLVWVHPITLKRAATGHGRATHRDMIKAARALGHDPLTDHQADALCLLEHFGDPRVLQLVPREARPRPKRAPRRRPSDDAAGRAAGI